MPVTGIGGVFFRAVDPDALRDWYLTHFGVGGFDWTQQPGPTVFMPFGETTDYFPAHKQWMINFRVTALDEMVAALSAAGVAVITDPAWDTPETGRFARVHDPEGNAVELWEPPSA